VHSTVDPVRITRPGAYRLASGRGLFSPRPPTERGGRPSGRRRRSWRADRRRRRRVVGPARSGPAPGPGQPGRATALRRERIHGPGM